MKHVLLTYEYVDDYLEYVVALFENKDAHWKM